MWKAAVTFFLINFKTVWEQLAEDFLNSSDQVLDK